LNFDKMCRVYYILLMSFPEICLLLWQEVTSVSVFSFKLPFVNGTLCCPFSSYTAKLESLKRKSRIFKWYLFPNAECIFKLQLTSKRSASFSLI
jgi:hypothetical protein